MRTSKFSPAFLAIFLILSFSCSKDEEPKPLIIGSEQKAVIYLGPLLNDFTNNETTRQESSDIPNCSKEIAAFAQVSLTYGESNIPVNVIVPILEDGGGLFTAYDESLEIPIPAGENSVSVTLNEFFVWSNDDGSPGVVIWAAPKTGSDFALFVNNSLPFSWDLRAGSKTYTNVDVLCFDERKVNEYGYVFFDIIKEVIYEVCFFANYCTDSGRHYVANYSLDVYYGTSNEGTPLYTEEVPITGDDGGFFADPLCFAIPSPQNDEDDDEPYLYYEATLLDWDDNYGTSNGESVSGTWTWNEVQALLHDDGETSEYYHAFINCDDDSGGPLDSDEDGYDDSIDNCPNRPNPNQEDADGDKVGDVCDNCVNIANPGQEDTNNNGIGDACEGGGENDDDGDGVPNDIDECPNTDSGVLVDEKGCESIQVPGRDVVVLNDINIFDENAMLDPDNLRFVQNLVNYTTTGSRNNGKKVWIDRGRNARCYNNTECNETGWGTMESAINDEGFTVEHIFSTSGSITNIPSDVKIVMLIMPTIHYTLEEINTLKQFAAQGGRIIFVGEHDQFYLNIDVENQFLANMGAVLYNSGGAVNCLYTILPPESNRTHPIMAGIIDLTIACASVIEPGEGDFPLFYDTTNTQVLGGVAKIDTSPISEIKPVAQFFNVQSKRVKLPNPDSSTGN